MPMTRLEELRRRVELDPTSPAFAMLAEEYRKAGQFDEAIATARTGLERLPSYLSARVTLGRALIEVNELGEARTHLEEVIRQAPENLAAIRALVDIHHRLVDPTQDTEVDALAAALDDRVGESSTDDASPPPSLAETPHPGTSAVTDGHAASLEALLAPLTESADEPASSALDAAFGQETDDVESLEALLGAVSEVSVGGKGPDVASTEPANIEPAGSPDLSSNLVQGAETPPPTEPPTVERPAVAATDERASLDDVPGEVAVVNGAGTVLESADVMSTEPLALPDLESALTQGTETPPLVPDFTVAISPPEPGGDGELPPVGIANALDEDSRVAVGLQRFLDAIVARRAERRKRTAE